VAGQGAVPRNWFGDYYAFLIWGGGFLAVGRRGGEGQSKEKKKKNTKRGFPRNNPIGGGS
jgi:hypothetical protein